VWKVDITTAVLKPKLMIAVIIVARCLSYQPTLFVDGVLATNMQIVRLSDCQIVPAAGVLHFFLFVVLFAATRSLLVLVVVVTRHLRRRRVERPFFRISITIIVVKWRKFREKKSRVS
jgi:hypothetical protein